MTRDDWHRLGVLLGVPYLALHALAAFWAAKLFLSLPMEAGGLFLGPVIGLPMAFAGMMLVVAAVMLATGREVYFVLAAVFVLMVVDGFAFMVRG